MPASLAQEFRRPISIARLYERHNREYSLFTIGEMCGAAGFEIEYMETDSSFPLTSYRFSFEEIENILQVIGIPELRRDTINVSARKISGVVERYPQSHELYLTEDD